MLSAFAKHNTSLIIFFVICILGTFCYGKVLIGFSECIKSYPGDLDPYDFHERIPVIYPQIEINFYLSDHLSIGCISSRTEIYCVLDRHVNTIQKMDIYKSGFFGELDLSTRSQFFGIGGMVQNIFGAYCVGTTREYDHGFGLQTYGIVRQPLYSNVFIGVRTGVERIWVHASGYLINQELILDSFFVDFTAYFDL